MAAVNVVILGAGSVGFELAKQLIEEDKEVRLIERDPDKAKQASNLLDCMVINEQASSRGTLEKAGVRSADYFVAVTESDELNMIACGMAASEYQVPHKVARIRNLDYSSTVRPEFLGIDYFVNPEIEAAGEIISAIERGAVSDVEFFEKSNLQMRSLSVGSGSPLAGRSISDLRESLDTHFLIAVIVRDNEYLIPRGDTVIQETDRLYLIATEESFEKLFATIGKARRKLNRIVFVGGGSVGRLVLEHLLERPRGRAPLIEQFLRYFSPAGRRRINIIDNDYRRCRLLSDQFPEALVVNADISDEGFAGEEHFTDTDLLVAATENQERNIVNAVYAKTLGAKRTIVLVSKTSYVHVASSLGIDVAVSPVDSTVSSILGYIRRASVRTVHSIPGGKVEVVELSVDSGGRVAGRTIKELRLPGQSLILSVNRDGRDIIPYGDFRFQAGDSMIVISPKDSVSRVEEVLAR